MAISKDLTISVLNDAWTDITTRPVVIGDRVVYNCSLSSCSGFCKSLRNKQGTVIAITYDSLELEIEFDIQMPGLHGGASGKGKAEHCWHFMVGGGHTEDVKDLTVFERGT